MNRITITQEARQTLSAARQSLEKEIREAKLITRHSHTAAPEYASQAQSRLLGLKRQATLLYIAIAAGKGKLHCKSREERIEGLLRRGSSEVLLKYLSPAEKLVLELFKAPAAAQALAPVAA